MLCYIDRLGKKMFRKFKGKKVGNLIFVFLFLIVVLCLKLVYCFNMLTLFYFLVVIYYTIQYVVLKLS